MTNLDYLKENSQDYLICVKNDGVRYLLVILENESYFLDRNMERVKLDIPLHYVSHLINIKEDV